MLHLLTTCEKTIRDESVAYCFLLKWEKKKTVGTKKVTFTARVHLQH